MVERGVLRHGEWNEMRWIHAAPVVTSVMQLVALGDLTDSQLPRDTVGVHGTPMAGDHPVPTETCCGPIPATAKTRITSWTRTEAIHLGPEQVGINVVHVVNLPGWRPRPGLFAQRPGLKRRRRPQRGALQ